MSPKAKNKLQNTGLFVFVVLLGCLMYVLRHNTDLSHFQQSTQSTQSTSIQNTGESNFKALWSK